MVELAVEARRVDGSTPSLGTMLRSSNGKDASLSRW